MISLLLLIPLTALLSALQGNNALGKGVLIAIHILFTASIGYLSGLPVLYSALAGAAVPAIFWFVLRGGWAADEEQDEMDRLNQPGHPMWKVALSHLPHLLVTLGFLGYGAYLGHWQAIAGIAASLLAYPLPILVLMRANYTDMPERINTGKFWDVRRPTEVVTGISGGVQGAFVLWTAIAIWGV